MLHKSQKQKLLLTNANILLKQSSFSTINDEAKPVRVNRKYKTQSYRAGLVEKYYAYSNCGRC